MIDNPDVLVILAACGIAGVCAEVAGRGYYASGVIGLGLIAWSTYQLSLYHPAGQAVAAVLFALVLFLFAFVSKNPYVYGIFATAALSIGTHALFNGSRQITLAVTLLVPMAVGGLLTYLVAIAGHARRAKRLSCYNSV